MAESNRKKSVDTPKVKEVTELKRSKAASTEVTAAQYAEMTGLNEGTKFWASKKFDSKEFKPAYKWADIFIKEGAIEEVPAILK